MPLVSIVLPTYNGARYIRETLDSCLAQTFRDFELIVVVDGSTDQTEEILATYQDNRIRILKTENQGQAMAMNTGFAVASGEYYSWTSDDNLYMPDAFQVMVDYMAQHPEAPAVSTDGLLIDENGAIKGYHVFLWQCFLYRVDAAEKVGPHRPEARILEDADFAVRLEHLAGPIHRISRPFLKYRVHSDSVSSTRRLERQLISTRISYDYIVQGFSKEGMKSMFYDRLSRCALYRDWNTMAEILDFGKEKGVDFLPDLEKHVAFLKSPAGWLINRVAIAWRSKTGALRDRLRLHRYRIRALLGRH